jgi:hypothetical protein
MLSAFLAYYAARAGKREQAAELLETGYGNFIDEPYLETDEFTGLPRTCPGPGRCSPTSAAT